MRARRHGLTVRRHFAILGLAPFAVCMLAASAFASPSGPVLGMLTDNGAKRIRVFDGDNARIAMEFMAPEGDAVGDCAVSSDQRLGFISASSGRIAFVELGGLGIGAAVPPMQSVVTALEIGNRGVDMALSPDEKFLVLAGGGALSQPLSVVDTLSRVERTGGHGPFVDHTSVEFCDDGTLLITTNHGFRYGARMDDALYSARLDDTGAVRLLGERLSSGSQPNNTACAPGSRAGVLLDRDGGVTSFTLPGLAPAERWVAPDDMAVSATFNSDGTRLYVRTARTVQAFDFDPRTGVMTADWLRQASHSRTFYGIDQIAMHPDGDRLFVDGGDALLILDPESGVLTGVIEAGDATGICFASHAAVGSKDLDGPGDGPVPAAPP